MRLIEEGGPTTAFGTTFDGEKDWCTISASGTSPLSIQRKWDAPAADRFSHRHGAAGFTQYP